MDTAADVVLASTSFETFLGVEFDSNAGTEAVYLDRVSFYVAAIPEPSFGILLTCLAACALIRRRK